MSKELEIACLVMNECGRSVGKRRCSTTLMMRKDLAGFCKLEAESGCFICRLR